MLYLESYHLNANSSTPYRGLSAKTLANNDVWLPPTFNASLFCRWSSTGWIKYHVWRRKAVKRVFLGLCKKLLNLFYLKICKLKRRESSTNSKRSVLFPTRSLEKNVPIVILFRCLHFESALSGSMSWHQHDTTSDKSRDENQKTIPVANVQQLPQETDIIRLFAFLFPYKVLPPKRDRSVQSCCLILTKVSYCTTFGKRKHQELVDSYFFLANH